MADVITHTFHTTKPDSPDSSLVSASEWEDGHTVLGGANGQTLTFDNTQPKNVRWKDGSTIRATAMTYSGATPSTMLGLLAFATVSHTIATIFVDFLSTISSGTTTTITIFVDGTAFANFVMQADGFSRQVPLRSLGLNAGNHTITFQFTNTGGGTFTNLQGEAHVLITGD